MVDSVKNNVNIDSKILDQSNSGSNIFGRFSSAALTRVAMRVTFVGINVLIASQLGASIPAALALTAFCSLPSAILVGSGWLAYHGIHIADAARWVGAADRIATSLEVTGALGGKWCKLLPVKEVVSEIHAATAGNYYYFLIGAGVIGLAFLAFQLHDHPKLPYFGPGDWVLRRAADWISGVPSKPPQTT